METTDKLKRDLQEGRISIELVFEVFDLFQRQFQASQQQLHATQQKLDETVAQLQAANQRIAELEKKLGGPTHKLDEPFSVNAEQKRQEARGKIKKRKENRKQRRGRIETAEKLALAERTEKVFPEGVPENECQFSHARPVWRIESGRAMLVAYEIYRGPGSVYGKIPGVIGRSEFGIEIVVQVSFLVHTIGLSFDKTCLLLGFFQQLSLSKSQAEALVKQLARHWESEFETLCTLLANSQVVHADETRWSLNSVWAFLSEKARVLLFGVHKDGDTLKEILDSATFEGIVISDDAAVYANFTQSQKCWAHLLRKAIKLSLLVPECVKYRDFTDQLLAIYRDACRVRNDRRLGVARRRWRVGELEDRVFDLCIDEWEKPKREGHADDYRLLANEIVRLTCDGELFTFVTAEAVEQVDGSTKPVDGTNNEAERSLRDAALARKTGRTSKTLGGARCKTIVASVLESLKLYLSEFTLQGVIDELRKWWADGRSCFGRMLDKLGKTCPEKRVLDRVFPKPPLEASPSG